MIAESSAAVPASSAIPKRSLFNKPSWSRPENLKSPADLFHRANHTYVDIAAEAERKRKVKLARRERQRVLEEGGGEPIRKRRCVSDESQDDDDYSSSGDGSKAAKEKEDLAVQATSVKTKRSSSGEPKPSHQSLSTRYIEAFTAPKTTDKDGLHQLEIIDLEIEENEFGPSPAEVDNDNVPVVTCRPSEPPGRDNEAASDEEFPELARKAREKARRKRLEAEMEHVYPDPAPLSSGDMYSRSSRSIHQIAPQPPPDPIVEILITSRIENTESLRVKRKISQRLKDVRVTWCLKQGFAQDFMSNVVLTWRGKRLFDVTTCKSLGIAVDQDGNVLTKGQKDIVGDEDRQVHMEAMTEGMLENDKKGKGYMVGGDEPQDHENDEEIVARQKQEPQVKIILKTKGFKDLKLIVQSVG